MLKFPGKFLPDFVGIGAMRSGTSWISRNLAQHPQIALAKRKELHFFDEEISSTRIPLLPASLEAKLRYSRYFYKGALSGKVTGEFTPAYAILPLETIQMIHSWMPNLRLIFVMRDPVQRAWSHARKDYEKYNGKPITDASSDELIEYFNQPALTLRGDYAACLSNWFSCYPRDRFFIGFTNEISSNPQDLISRIMKFVGVDADVEFDKSHLFSQVNARPVSTMPSVIEEYLSETLYRQNPELERMTGCKLPW